MNWTKFSIATLIGGVVYFLAGWLFYGILFANLFSGHPLRSNIVYAADDFKIGLMAISCVAMGAFISYVFLRWARISTPVGGARGGAIMGAFTSLVTGMALAAEYKVFDVESALYDVVANALCAALAGAAIGWYIGREK